MAKKEETLNMVEQFTDFKDSKNIDKATMMGVLEESFRNVLQKMFGTDENLDVILNPDKGLVSFLFRWVSVINFDTRCNLQGVREDLCHITANLGIIGIAN